MGKGGLQSWLLGQLREAYDAELQLESALPRWAEASSDQRLRGTFFHILLRTRAHGDRQQEAFRSLGEKPYGSHSAAMQAILAEANSLFQTSLPSVILDAGLIAVLSKALHYQIATYRTLQIYGSSILDENGLQALAETLEEKEAARGELVDLAVNHFFASTRNKDFVAG